MPDNSQESLTNWGVGHATPRLKRVSMLTRLALALEHLSAAFWPLPVLLLFFFTLVFFDLLPRLPGWLHVAFLVSVLAACAGLAWRGLKHWRQPTYQEARRRLEVENDLRHRPLVNMDDRLASGRGNKVSETLWRQHRQKQLAALGQLRAPLPRPVLARFDPWAMRGLAILVFVVSLTFGYGDWRERVARAFQPQFGALDRASLKFDAWISPPAYTALPPIFLTAEEQETVEVVEGSSLLAQVQGAEKAELLVDERVISFERFAQSALKVEQILTSANTLGVEADGESIGNWAVSMIADMSPTAVFTAPPRKSERLSLRIDYEARDDFGLESLTAEINRIVGAGNSPLELEIFLPRTGAQEAAGASFHDLTAHPWAGLAVEVRLVARDALGQEGTNDPARIVLPERFFEHPVARAIIELRKQLTIEPDKRAPVASRLEELAARPEHYRHDTLVALALYVAAGRLIRDTGMNSVPEVQEILWDTALRIEEGELGIAERDLRQIQEALLEALAQGADDSEIERLMDELQQALENFLQALAEQMMSQAQQGGPPPDLGQDGQLIDSDQLREMIEKARELAKSGARDAAQELLAQLQNILENLRAQPLAEGMEGEFNDAHRLMSQMEDMLNQQQDLLDRSFERSQRTSPSEGESDQPSPENQLDAQEQEALRKQLGEMMRQLGDMLGDIPQSLGRAEQDMRSARDALNRNRPGQAVQPQARSLDQLQQGMRSMAESFLQMFDNLQERGSGNLANRPGRGSGPDPLGRESGMGRKEATQGVDIPDEAELQRSREILDELRRRRGERFRPPVEIDYIDRLLRRF